MEKQGRQNKIDACDAADKPLPWQKPEILSVEPLEAAASICEPNNAPFGKDFPGTCGTLGS